MENIPDHIINKIADPAERAKHTTWTDAKARDFLKLERQLHNDFSGFLHRREILFRHTNPVKKTTDGPGWPDYQIFGKNGRSIWIEFKVGGNKPSQEQEIKFAQLRALGHQVFVIHDYETAVRAVIHFLSL